MHRSLHYLAGLYVASGGLMILGQVDTPAASWISLVNTGLLTIGGSVILLYQRKLSVDRESQHVSDQLVSQQAFDAVSARLDAVIEQRDKAAARNEQLLDQLIELNRRVDAARCVFPVGEKARCTGLEHPPCLE